MVNPYRKSLILILSFQSCLGSVIGEESKPIYFESLFPDSPYRNVYRLCVDMWHQVRLVRGVTMNEEQWRSFNNNIIDSLINLHSRVGTMIENPSSCSPDDLEHLMSVLRVMHVEYEYVATPHRGFQNEKICGGVLFNRIEEKLEKMLL